MIAAGIQNEFNRHIQFEMASSYLYLSMAAWCDVQGLKGFSNWMRQQAEEAPAAIEHCDAELAR